MDAAVEVEDQCLVSTRTMLLASVCMLPSSSSMAPMQLVSPGYRRCSLVMMFCLDCMYIGSDGLSVLLLRSVASCVICSLASCMAWSLSFQKLSLVCARGSFGSAYSVILGYCCECLCMSLRLDCSEALMNPMVAESFCAVVVAGAVCACELRLCCCSICFMLSEVVRIAFLNSSSRLMQLCASGSL